jgi:PAS domain S-box-containing protein
LAACLIQWLGWPVIAPFAWFLFYPVVFLSSWVGGFGAGLASTLLSTGLVWWFFLTPVHTLVKPLPGSYIGTAMFMAMGFLLSYFHRLLHRANRKAALALEAEHQATFRQAAVGLGHMTLDGGWLQVNQRCCEILGYSREELLATPWDTIAHPDDLESDRSLVRRMVAGEFSERVLETRFIHKNGSTGWLNLAVSLVRDAKGDPGYIIVVVEDITRRKRVELDLANSEARFRALFEQAGVGVVEVSGATGQFIRANGKFCEFLGYAEAEILAMTFLDVTHPDDMERNGRQVEALFHGELPMFTLEKRYLRKDGTTVWAALTARALNIPGETVRHLVSVVADITARKQAEEQLRENRAYLDAALASMTDAVFISNAAGEFIEFNEAFATFHRFASKAECAGKLADYPDIIDVFMANGEPAPLDMWAVPRALRGETVTNAEYSIRRKDTGESWVGSYSFSPIRDKLGEIVGSVVVGRDITDRKRVEDELRRNQARLAAVFAAIPDVILEYDTSGRAVMANDAALHVAGVSSVGFLRNAVVAKLGFKKIGDPSASPDTFPVSRALRGETVAGELFSIRTADGMDRVVSTFAAPFWEGGKVTGAVGLWHDVTDLKRAEEKLSRNAAELEQRVAERTAQLEAANSELESFSYAVSHDLRAPLRAMDGFSQVLLEDFAGGLNEEGKAYLAEISRASQRMKGLIDGLLQLSHANRGDMERVPVDLSALSGALLAELARTDPERGVQWRIEPGIQVQGDPRMLASAMGNLLGNAWKYSSRVPRPSIEVDTVLEDGRPWVRVADNGCGFDMAHADKLFKPFQRLHRQDEFPGLGIGLATVQRIVQRHGGCLKAVSAPGQGAAFLMSLPT